jgi:hypothetical protein
MTCKPPEIKDILHSLKSLYKSPFKARYGLPRSNVSKARKFDKISDKLEADEYIIDGDLWKPKGMHWQTFHRLKMAEINADDHWGNAFLARFGHWL